MNCKKVCVRKLPKLNKIDYIIFFIIMNNILFRINGGVLFSLNVT